jgi:hypothetical protein
MYVFLRARSYNISLFLTNRTINIQARPTYLHGKTAKQFPVNPSSDKRDSPISWAKQVSECPPELPEEQLRSVAGLSVLDAVNILGENEEADPETRKPNVIRTPYIVLRLAHYVSTVTTPNKDKFTSYQQAGYLLRHMMTDEEFKIRYTYGYEKLSYEEVMRLKQLFAYTTPSGSVCKMVEPSSKSTIHAKLLRRRLIVRNALLFLRRVHAELQGNANEISLGEWPRDLFWNDKSAATSIMSLNPPKSFTTRDVTIDSEGVAYFTINGKKVYVCVCVCVSHSFTHSYIHSFTRPTQIL